MPDWTPRFGSGQNLTANQIGREAGPLFQPFVQSVQPDTNARLRFQTNPVQTAKGRPYADVGKMSLNLGSVGETAKAGEQAGGIIQGFGAGAGRFLGGIIGQGQAGADIGEFIGGLGQMPLDIAGNALGALPAIPLMGGVGPATGMPGGHSVFDLPFMGEEERAQVLSGWDNNPLSLARHVSDWNKQDWAKKIEAGQISPLWKDMAPAASLGDQVMELLGVFNLPSRALERTLAGGPLDAVSRVNNTPDEHLNPEIVKLKQAYADGTITKDRFLDELVMANAGYSNDWGLNLLGSMVLDPLLLGGEVAAIAGKAALVAKMEKATQFTSLIGKEATNALSKGLEETALRAGKPVSEITGPEIMAEAERLGLHPDALAEARKQLTGRQQFLTDNAFLEPAFKVANSIAQGPLPAAIGMIGRRGSKPVVSAWLSSQATRGMAEHYGRANWRTAQTMLSRLGKQDIFDEGMGYAAAQTGMAMQQDLLGKDVIAMRGAVLATPTEVAKARLRIGTQQYYRQIERFLSDRSADLTLPTGLQTAEQAMARAQDNAVQQLVNMAGISGQEARGIVSKMDAKGLSMIDMAHYGHRIKVFNAAKRADQEALAAAATAAGPASRGGGVLDRVTLIGPRELTAGRAEDLQTALDTLPTHEAAEAGRAAIRRFDYLGEHQLADGPTDEEIVSSLRAWLSDHGDSLTKELTGEESAKLTPELTRTLDEGDGYIYGLRPEDGAEWRIKTDPEDPSRIVSSRPWVDIVGDVAQPWSNRFNGDSGVSSMLNALDQVTGTLSHQITTDRITAEARRAFIEKGMNGYAPSQKTALTYQTARELWDGVRSKAVDLGTTPRGMKLEEFKDVLDKIPAAKAAGLSERDLMGMALSSMEGRVGTVGVTQKLTGSLKTKTMNVPFLPANTVGQMAERMYPMVRFSMNPFFQLQEWVEPWVFMAARGKMARLSTGWIDPTTGQRVEATELMRVQQNLIDRYAAIDPTAQFDQMERSLAYVYASKAAKDVSATADIGRIEAARGMLRGIGTTGDRKAIAQSEMFRHFLGPTLKGYFNAIDPGKWAELEATYGTRDMGQIAVRWLSETDAWANIEPRAANVRLQATKARYIGKTAPVELDGMAQHSFGTTRPALTIMARDGSLTHDVFNATLREAGADESYIARSWKALQFDVKTGGVESFWKQMTEGAGARPQIEVDMARALVLAQADAHGISEVEYLSRHLNGHVSTVMQDDLIAGLSGDYAGWDALFQQAKYALDNWFSSDPETGAIIHQRLDPAEAERRFLSQSTEPPSSMPVEQHGAYNDMQKVEFGAGGRSLYIPGGMAALDDLEKPFTVWESHLIRNQLVDPNELLDPKLKHALYEKMWRGHQFDMTDGENVFRVYNNTVMAMLSAGLNLTRNELVSTRFRVGSMDELRGLAADVGGLRDTIKATLPKGAEVKANDLGLAYSTRSDVAHYLPLDSVESLEKDAYLPAARTTIHATARLGRGYLDGADRALHAKTMRAYAQRDAVRAIEARSQKALDDAQEALDKAVASGDQEAVTAAEATVAERKLARESIDPEQALADIEARDQAAIDNMDETAMAAMDRRDEKAIGRISEWAVDLAVEAINKTGLDLRGVLPSEFKVASIADMTEADQMRFYGAAKALAKDPEDLAARDIIRELVPGAAGVDNNLIWKPWNVNGAGLPHAVAPDGRVVGHADADIFGYVKNNDVAWRGFSTNAGMGNALMMAEDMVAHPEHYARRAGAEFAPKKGAPVAGYNIHFETDPFTSFYDREGLRFSEASFGTSGNGRSVQVTDKDGKVVGFVYASIDPETNTMKVAQSQVLDPHGRKGIGNWMYRQLEEQTGATLVPAREQSPTARALWAQHDRPFGPQTRTVREFKTANAAGTLQPRGPVEMRDPNTLIQTGRIPQPEEDPYALAYLEPGDIAEGIREPIRITPEGKIIDGNDRMLAAKQAGVEVPVQVMDFPVRQGAEPLDMFAERLSHRTRGLSLKTGFFGVDLGDPINFERGVMDTHMVGGLTEWFYHDVTNKGTTQEWTDFMASLSPAKQAQINGWIARKFTRVDEKIEGKTTGKKIEVPYPQGAPRGAGVYDWSEATGKSVNFKGKIAADADVAQRAGFVRAKISKLPQAEQDRLFAMYRNDAELAELYGRDVKIFGGDYQAYENLMTRRKAEEALTDPTLDRHGNGGYQWKLWDDRRMVLDPETSAYAAAHTMPRASVRYMAASDDLHYASGFMDKGGLRSVSDAGYRYLDPVPTMMAQQQGHLLRGATIFGDRTDAVIAITEHANSSTVTHEIAHALLEPNLDVSGKAVVMDDINRVVDEFNTKLVADTAAAKTAFVDQATEVTRVEGVHATYQATAKEAGATARTAVATVQKAERDLAKAETALAEKVGALKQLTKDVPARKKAVEGLQPSVKARRLAAIDNDLKRVQDTVDTLTSTRDAIRDSIDPLWDEANAARAAAQSAEQDVSIIAENLRAMKGEMKMAADEYGRLATTPARATKDVWDTEVSEHFADQFNVWLRTGKASNPKLRDTFAYFHRLLSKLEDWVKGNPQVKVSPAMQDLFDRMHTPQVKASAATANAIPFDATQEMFHEAGRHAVVDAADAAHTNVQFRRSRSMFERSLNHPYFGIYPSSYMWGKVAPEMIRALALNPFGIPIPGLVEGAAPGLGFVNAQRAWQAVEMQKDTDPKFRGLMNDPQNDKMFRAASMFLPATPWDDPANFPLWSRRLAEWGLESQDRAALGQEPKGFDPFKVGSEVASYAFGPKATLDWLGDVARFSKAPAVTQFSGSGIENLGPQSLVVTAHGMTPLEQVNAEGAANLRKSLGS